jgi:hypothetical protein
MRRRLLLIVPIVAIVLALGAGLAVYLTRSPPSGTLETNVTDVTVVAPGETAPSPQPAPPPPTPSPEPVDKRCWTMFGGGPRRTLARPDIDLGIPASKPLWARGLGGYIEYPASYCNGMLYVNTFKGDTWAIEAATGKVLWTKVSNAPKPSTPAIAPVPNDVVAACPSRARAEAARPGWAPGWPPPRSSRSCSSRPPPRSSSPRS